MNKERLTVFIVNNLKIIFVATSTFFCHCRVLSVICFNFAVIGDRCTRKYVYELISGLQEFSSLRTVQSSVLREITFIEHDLVSFIHVKCVSMTASRQK